MRWYKEILCFSWHFGPRAAWDIALCPRLMKTHSRAEGIMSFLERVFKDELASLRAINTISDEVLSRDERIWLCWWQGEKDMPQTIRNCVDSISYHHKDCSIVIIDKDNYSDYVEIPKGILDKVERKVITLTQLSDILRCGILDKYGGIWLDAALFCTSHGHWENEIFFSPKIRCENNDHISGFKWVPGCIGAIPQFPLFGFAFQCFKKYWERYSFLVDFLMVDYIFELAYRNNTIVQEIIDRRPYDNEGIHSSRYLFNEKCDESVYQQLIKNNTFLSLTWRFPYRTNTGNGELTYYGRLLKDFDRPQ